MTGVFAKGTRQLGGLRTLAKLVDLIVGASDLAVNRVLETLDHRFQVCYPPFETFDPVERSLSAVFAPPGETADAVKHRWSPEGRED